MLPPPKKIYYGVVALQRKNIRRDFNNVNVVVVLDLFPDVFIARNCGHALDDNHFRHRKLLARKLKKLYKFVLELFFRWEYLEK